jgi:hypothetical protein
VYYSIDVQLGYRKDERGLGSRIKAKVKGWKAQEGIKKDIVFLSG